MSYFILPLRSFKLIQQCTLGCGGSGTQFEFLNNDLVGLEESETGWKQATIAVFFLPNETSGIDKTRRSDVFTILHNSLARFYA